MVTKKLISISFLFAITFSLVAQTPKSNSTQIENLNKRIEILEGQKENLNKQSDILQQDFDLKKQNLDTQFSENKIEIDKDLSGLRNLMYTLGAGVLGLLLLYFGYIRSFIKKKSEEIAEKKIAEVIGSVVEKNKDKIVNIIESQDIELKVKKENKLLIISETDEDKEFISKFFKEAGISNFDFADSANYNAISNEIDLVVFDDRRATNKFHDLFNEYLEKSNENTLFIFFGDRFNAAKRDNINYANSKYTLYNQIINSLKFKEVMKK